MTANTEDLIRRMAETNRSRIQGTKLDVLSVQLQLRFHGAAGARDARERVARVRREVVGVGIALIVVDPPLEAGPHTRVRVALAHVIHDLAQAGVALSLI